MSELQDQKAQTLAFFQAIGVSDDYAVAIRALGVQYPIGEGVYTSAESAADAAAALTARGDCKGVYVIPNPIKPGAQLRFQANTFATRLPKSAMIKDGDIARRALITVDVDSIKIVDGEEAKGIPATTEERGHARRVASAVVEVLAGCGWPNPIVVDTGNGTQLFYRCDLPCDADHDHWVRSITKGLHERFKSEVADVDQAVFNPARLVRLPGTVNRKGIHREDIDRLHRVAQLEDLPDGWGAHPVSEAAFFAAVDLLGERLTPAQAKALAEEQRAARAAAPSSTPPRQNLSTGFQQPVENTEFYARVNALAAENTGWVRLALEHIDVSVRPHWLSAARAVKGLMGDDGAALWLDWSATYGGDADIDERTWEQAQADDTDTAQRALCGMAKGFKLISWLRGEGLLPPATPQAGERAQAAQAAAQAQVTPAPHIFVDASLRHDLSAHWLTSRPRFIVDEAILAVAAAVNASFRLCAEPVKMGGDLLVCDPATFRWSAVSATEVAQMMRRWVGRVPLGAPITPDTDPNKVKFFTGRQGSKKVFDEVLCAAGDVTRIKQQQGAQLIVSDGALVLDPDTGRVTLQALEPSHYATYGYDISSAQIFQAQAPRFMAYVQGLFPDAKDPALTVEYLLRWIALAVFGATIQYQAPAIILKGVAGTGKSTLGKIIQRLMPADSTCSVPLQDWHHEYNRASLVGKLFNFVPELAIDEPVGGLDQVKKIIFGELTSARQIYSAAQSFHPQAAHLFCANGLPNMRKADPAVFKRFVQLEVTAKVVRGTAGENTEFDRELVEGELAGILGVLIAAYERAHADRAARKPGTLNGLPVLAETQAANDEWHHRSDAVGVWLSETYTKDDAMPKSSSPTVASMYARFKDWCADNGYSLMNRGSFKAQLSGFYRIEQSHKQDVAVGALQLIDSYASNPDDSFNI